MIMRILSCFALFASLMCYSCAPSSSSSENAFASDSSPRQATTLNPFVEGQNEDCNDLDLSLDPNAKENIATVVTAEKSIAKSPAQSKNASHNFTTKISKGDLIYEEFLKQFNFSQPQDLYQYTINTSEDVHLVCQKGTILDIKAGSFVYPNGEIASGEIKLTVKEYYTTADIIKAKLSTESNGRLLETGGMLYISAKGDKGECQLAKGSTIDLQMPTPYVESNMLLFEGSRNARTGNINWNQTGVNTTPQIPLYLPSEVTTQAYFKESEETPFPDKIGLYKAKEMTKYDNGVLLGFIVSPEGQILHVNTIKGMVFKPEVVERFVNLLPNIEPATVDGIPVYSYILMPIALDLKNKEFLYYKNYNPENERKLKLTRILPQNCVRDKQFYTFRLPHLGWINCDRFYDVEERVPVLVDASNVDTENITTTYCLIFKEIKSIMNGSLNASNMISFAGVPKDTEVRLLGVGIDKEGKYYLSVKDFTTSEDVVRDITFNPLNRTDIDRAISKASFF